MRVLQIDISVNTGSTGKIAEGIGKELIKNNFESYIAFGRNFRKSESKVFKIGNRFEQLYHLILTRIFDLHGYGSKSATNKLIKYIEGLNPDVIHLHQIHGYYINLEVLFTYLEKLNKPIVWTFHDCWPFTGHCCHFERVNCKKWKTECYDCELTKYYPKSLFIDNSKRNFRLKKELFTNLKKLTIVPVSDWMMKMTQDSFFKNKSIVTIHNGINVDVFRKVEKNFSDILLKYQLQDKKIILGVANIWSDLKGLAVFFELSKLIPENYKIVLIGLNERQIKLLPKNIVGIKRTENEEELVYFYTIADVFVNPSIAESFGLVTLEAQACGTPVIVFNNTASPELVKENTGFIVESNDINELFEKTKLVIETGKNKYSKDCVNNVTENYNFQTQVTKYITLYKEGNKT